jgi:hypothetical protein
VLLASPDHRSLAPTSESGDSAVARVAATGSGRLARNAHAEDRVGGMGGAFLRPRDVRLPQEEVGVAE